MDYNFYGWETANARPLGSLYPSIHNPRDLYDALCGIWNAETCAPRMRGDWTRENKTLGQCSITAFLAQDIFGGKVYGIALPDGGVHCYNVADGCRFDLASEQFGEKAKDLIYDDTCEQTREAQFVDEEKRLRYEMLKTALAARERRLPRP